MIVSLESPVVGRLEGVSSSQEEVLLEELSYVDKRVEFELGRTKASVRRFRSPRAAASLKDSWGREKYERVLSELEEKIVLLQREREKCLLERDESGLWVRSGLAPRVAALLNVQAPEVCYELPSAQHRAWDRAPEFSLDPYQVEAVERLLEGAARGPVGVELPTGSGKTTVLRQLLHQLGLPALVMAPSVSIATQIADDFARHFGSKNVGLYGNGKKQANRRIVVGIDASLAKLEPGSRDWDLLAAKQVFAVDESHLTPASSLQKVCFGLAADAPYRFFVSATQMRGDGLDLVLESITGELVTRLTLRDLVDQGYLAQPKFKMVRVRSYSRVRSEDQNVMTREHLFYNPVVNRVAGDLAVKFVKVLRRPTLILVEELEQFRELLPHLGDLRVGFAHGPLTAATKSLVPEAYQKLKPSEQVAQFNAGDLDVLVGTSCISTGTDIQVAGAGIYLMGGHSEVKVRQALGRETRGGLKRHVVNPWTGEQKIDCVHVDFDVVDGDGDDSFTTHRHALRRAATYADLFSEPRVVDYTHLGAR